MRVYVSGPMKGYPEKAARLRGLGYDVVSSHEVEVDTQEGTLAPDSSEFYDNALKADIREMMTCDAVVTLKGWEASRGARLEVSIAIQVGMKVHHERLP